MALRSLLLFAAAFPLMAATAAAPGPAVGHLPFQVGERLTFDAKINSINAGKATLSIEGVETIRGIGTMHAVFDVRGRVLFKKFANHYESWFDTTSLASVRHIQNTDDVDKSYDFYWDRKVYVKNKDGVDNPSVALPLDEASFLYFLRTIPLEVGKTVSYERYYHALKNPIVITVVRRERVKVPAGEFDAFVLKPVIKSNGMFSPKSDAEVWLAADPARTFLKLRSKLPLGTLYLELRTIERPD